ncbi:CAP domain-containing protein [Ilumatobacter sp.]|uniref:CAP domain-containing protein n=1 Tax=Ilumatobacter sp. TaxID=1967498 RepID=UPI003AF56688
MLSPLPRRRFWSAVALCVAAPLALATLPASPVAADDPTTDGLYAGAGLRPAGSVLELDVTGRGGTASNASAVSLNLTATQTGGEGFATVYPCGTSRPGASTINYSRGETIANGIIAKVGSNGKVCIYTHAPAHLIVDVNGFFPAGTDYRALPPARLLDTRPGQRTSDGRHAGDGVRRAGTVLELDVAGRGGTASNAAAVTVNLTTTQPNAAGFATLYPCGTSRPGASTINYSRGETIANSVITKVGSNGKVCIFTHAQAHVIADVTGFFPAGSDFRSLAPARLLDTRPGASTTDGRSAGTGQLGAGKVLALDVTGRGGTSSSSAAVSLNLTVTQTGGEGFATVYPCGSSRPEASTINYRRGETIANGIIAKVGSNGKVCIYSHASAHVIVDVDGFFPAGSDYRALTPARLLDSRPVAPPGPSDPAAAESLALLNQLRAAHGAGPVTYDANMSAQAMAWSQEMSRSGFRHSSLGYAENIAWHSQSSMSPSVAATTLHNMWVNSPGHFQNMINPRWTKVGIGLHQGGGWWGTHVFTD